MGSITPFGMGIHWGHCSIDNAGRNLWFSFDIEDYKFLGVYSLCSNIGGFSCRDIFSIESSHARCAFSTSTNFDAE